MHLKTSFINADVRLGPLSERISAGKDNLQKIFMSADATALVVMVFKGSASG